MHDKYLDDKVRSYGSIVSVKYDERSSYFVNAGVDEGVGKKQPVGSKTHSNKSVIPRGGYSEPPHG
jgi:hypothetical protein